MPEGSAPLDSAPLDSAPLDSAPLDSAPLDDAAAEGAHAKLGCRTCDTTHAVPHDEALRLRLLAFFDEHGSGHQPWIDLSAAGPLRLPEQRSAQNEAAS